MINLILYGALAFVGVKIVSAQKSGNTTSQVRNTRSQVPISGHASSIPIKSTGAAGGVTGPGSGLSNPAGNANQPWYTGAAVAAAGVAAADIAKGIGSLFETAASPQVEPDVSSDELDQAQSEMATSNMTATDENEDFSSEAAPSDDTEV